MYCSPLKSVKGGKNGKTIKSCLNRMEKKLVKDSLTKKEIDECIKDELCLVKKASTRNNNIKFIYEKSFLPEAPETWKFKKDVWLTNHDINNVMRQYEDAHKHFKFLNAVPLNFNDQHVCGTFYFDFCNLKLEKDKTCYAIVVNLSKYGESGSHWVAYIINIKKKCAFYFDSGGAKMHDSNVIPSSVIALHKKFKDLIKLQEEGRIRNKNDITNVDKKIESAKKRIDRIMTLKYNKQRYQTSNTECGIFCIAFITLCLNSKNKCDYEVICDRIKQLWPGIDKAEARKSFFQTYH